MIWLRGVQILGGGYKSIGIQDGRIAAIADVESAGEPAANRQSEKGSCSLQFENCVAFPGLINSHDHLQFNLFPRLGNRIYNNYVEWGRDIAEANRAEIDAVQKIPRELRWRWGVYKNLLNGVTTVVHHGERVPCEGLPLTVHQRCHVLHSVKQEPRWRRRLNFPIVRPWPYVIHVGEGTDSSAREEIDTLLSGNLFRRALIAVHGVAMTEAQAKSFAALIWCPDSNYFLLNKTADIAGLSKIVPIVFGTDSTLTASWNMWEQLRFARSLGMMADEVLFRAVSRTPARVWNLPDRGELREGFRADLVVANARQERDGYAGFVDLNPEDIALMIHKGRIVVCDEIRYRQAREAGLSDELSRFSLGDTVKYVFGDPAGLVAEIRRHAPNLNIPPINGPPSGS
jgi:cytosine/adenosine deaminase-related metal-dependent hydrolase